MSELEERLRRVRLIVCDVDGVLTDGSIAFDGKGRPMRTFHVRDVTSLTFWRLAGGLSALVSGLGSKAVEALAETWRVTEVHTWVKNKQKICHEIAERHGLSMDELAFLGDDIIDKRAMEAVGLAVAVSDAAPEIRAIAHFVTESAGGKGALREVVEQILRAQGRYERIIEEYAGREDIVAGPHRTIGKV
jgi:3-deoxy-D-manno-octulosonate 8-phosphate phosphatase (KDO 8-P phosphatase)